MRIWLSKPFYEMLPYLYLLAASGFLLASLYLNYWYWPIIGAAAGLACLIAGVVVLLRRRYFRGLGTRLSSNRYALTRGSAPICT